MLSCWKTDPKDRHSFVRIYKHLTDFSKEILKSSSNCSINVSETHDVCWTKLWPRGMLMIMLRAKLCYENYALYYIRILYKQCKWITYTKAPNTFCIIWFFFSFSIWHNISDHLVINTRPWENLLVMSPSFFSILPQCVWFNIL